MRVHSTHSAKQKSYNFKSKHVSLSIQTDLTPKTGQQVQLAIESASSRQCHHNNLSGCLHPQTGWRVAE